MRRSLYTILILFLGSQAFSQHSSAAYRKLADSLYRHHHYQHAADYYERAMKKSAEPGSMMLQIAKSYEKINLPYVAEKWFREARAKNATFTREDYFQFAQVLMKVNKRNEADALLEHILQSDPNDNITRRALDDLRGFLKYYQDSASVKVDTLSINSAEAEFAPVYYKEGIVFSSARLEGAFKKKYHWDNSHFINLYFSAKTGDNRFASPQLFEEDISTRHHDGPAMFYAQNQRMILNRNQNVKASGREDVYEWRPGLYDAQYDQKKSAWQVTPLPFNESSHSYAHPSISEDGNTLYFSSDRPGGYGGMDLYRVVRSDGIWGKPFNLGPAVNTTEDEVFPLFIDNTLYFSSTGHGGLGGLDLFTSTLTVNGFTNPVNLGYPINSFADDFSLITQLDQRNGYFASSRKGNDDLFSFQKDDQISKILAHIFDGETKVPLPAADAQLITNTRNDSTLSADEQGNFELELPMATAYVIIATKDDKIGMVSNIADVPSKEQPIPVYSDTSRIACIGIIQDELGQSKKASLISITDETTGQKLDHAGDQPFVTFMGEKGHNYSVEVQDDQGSKAFHQLEIKPEDKDTKTWIMVLPNTPKMMDMAARVFRADDEKPLGFADIEVITFNNEDQQLTADADGRVDFKLAQGTAYVVIASKDDLSGMHSGSSDPGTDKDSIIHPIPAYGDLNDVLAIGLVTNTSGKLVDDYKAEITKKGTGENVPAQAEKGVLTFIAERGESYNISVAHDDYQTALQELSIPLEGPDKEKFNVVLQNKPGPEMVIPLALSVESMAVVENIKDGKSDLLVVDTEKGTSKMYIKSGESISEITERDSTLYRQTQRGDEYLGKGQLSNLRNNPSTVLEGVQKSNLTNLRNIYFEFDKANLDDKDREYLQELKSVLDHDRSLNLLIAGHADDRGNDNYNIRLSRRRAQAVSKFLIDHGIEKERIILKAYGESLPVVPCVHGDCSEEDHQKNRRAEFVLGYDDISTIIEPLSQKDIEESSTNHE